VFDSRQGQEIILYSTASRSGYGTYPAFYQMVPGTSSPGLKRPRPEADHSPPSSAEVKNYGLINPFHGKSSRRGALYEYNALLNAASCKFTGFGYRGPSSRM
jgi:hypothetical protein